jgi:hypothetical protein
MKKIIVFMLIILSPLPLFSGDIILKLGYDFSGSSANANESWRLGFEYDSMNWQQYGIGFELQAFYFHGKEGYYSIPFNLFAHLKWKSKIQKVKPYLGLGFGMLSYIGSEEWIKGAVLHTLGGIEIGTSKKINVIAEVQFNYGFTSFPSQFCFFSGIKW